MHNATRLDSVAKFWAIVAVVVTWLFSLPLKVEAQNTCVPGSQGQNGVYNATCNNGNPGVVGSSAFIDASMFAGQLTNPNLCSVVNYVLVHVVQPTYPNGAVIDARGLANSTPPTSMTCTTANPSPWAGITNPPPSTILLPATGTNPIVIPATWVMPTNTRVVGEGDNDPSGSTPNTTIQACMPSSTNSNCSFTGTDMIDLGTSLICDPLKNGNVCNDVSVENLTLDAQGQSLNGIVNTNAQNGTRVTHVSLYRILGTGLSVSSNANNSGPYSDITFDVGGNSGTSSTVCANINGLTGTYGIHGLTCISQSSDAPAAVLLDSSNNSIEDVAIAGFYSGIVVGSQAPARSNVLVNISDSTKACNPQCPPVPVNMVHITNDTTNGSPNVADLSIMGASNDGQGTNTIVDDLTSTKLADASVAIYALGESASGGYSRFTTSPNAATWAVGATSPTGDCVAATRGSLYSCTGGNTNCSNGQNAYALWTCALNSSNQLAWIPIK